MVTHAERQAFGHDHVAHGRLAGIADSHRVVNFVARIEALRRGPATDFPVVGTAVDLQESPRTMAVSKGPLPVADGGRSALSGSWADAQEP